MTLRVHVDDIERDLLDLAAYQADAEPLNNVTDDVTVNIATPELKVTVSPPSIFGGLRTIVEDVLTNAGANASVKGVADAILGRAQDAARLIDGFSVSKPISIAFTVETDNEKREERCYEGKITFTGLIDRTHPTLFEWETQNGLLSWNHTTDIVRHLPAGTTGNQRVLRAEARVLFKSRSKDLFFNSVVNFHLQFRGLKNAASVGDIGNFVASTQSSFIHINGAIIRLREVTDAAECLKLFSAIEGPSQRADALAAAFLAEIEQSSATRAALAAYLLGGAPLVLPKTLPAPVAIPPGALVPTTMSHPMEHHHDG